MAVGSLAARGASTGAWLRRWQLLCGEIVSRRHGAIGIFAVLSPRNRKGAKLRATATEGAIVGSSLRAAYPPRVRGECPQIRRVEITGCMDSSE